MTAASRIRHVGLTSPTTGTIPYIYIVRSLYCAAVFLLSGFIAVSAAAQDCTRFLNATEGDDGNSGDARARAVRSFEHAFLTFPSGSVICMTAGEYFAGVDADGIQLTGNDAQNKDMRFVLESFGGSSVIRFTEDEFLMDIGSGRLTFEAGSTNQLQMGTGEFNSPSHYPSNTNFLHTLALLSGTLDASAVNLEIETPVGNPNYAHPTSGKTIPTAAVIRGTGTMVATGPFTSAARVLRYVGGGDRTSDGEIPPELLRLEFEHSGGVVRIDDPLSFAPGGNIASESAGSAVISTSVTLSPSGAPAILHSGTGLVDFSGSVLIQVGSDLHGVVQNTGAGTLTFKDLLITPSSLATQDINSTIVNSGAGTITFLDILLLPSSSGRMATVVVENQNSGRTEFGSPTTATIFSNDIHNLGSGTAVILGESVLTGSLVNRGTFILDGAIDLAGQLENSGSIQLLSNVTLSGILSNGGTLSMGSFLFTITSEGPHTNSGTIEADAPGGMLLLQGSVSLLGDGILSHVTALSGSSVISASIVSGDVVAETGATLSLERVTSIGGNVSVQGGIIHLPSTTISGDLQVEDGFVLLDGAVTILSDFHQLSPGSIDLAGHDIALSGDFEREGGAFSTSGGAVVFRGLPIQILRPGPDLTLDELRIESTRVVLSADSVSVVDVLRIEPDSELLLFDFELKLVGSSTAVINNGDISTSITGDLRFAGPPGSAQRLAGSGLYGNVAVDLQDENDSILIEGEAVRQSGILSLTRGAATVVEGSSFVLSSIRGTPHIRRNLGDANTDGAPDGKGIIANIPGAGRFETPPSGYNLEYFGTIGGRSETGAEFLSSGIVDLRIAIEGRGDLPAVLVLTSDLNFSGSLELLDGAVLDLGPHELTATEEGAVHSVRGAIDAMGGAFVISGTGRIRGAGGESASSIRNLSIRSTGSVDIIDMNLPGRLDVGLGRVSLDLIQGDMAASIGTIAVSGGELSLAGPISIEDSLLASGGRLILNAYDLVMVDEATFQIALPASIDQGGTGSLVWSGSGSMETGDAHIPRLVLDAGPQDRVVLTGPAGVSQSFTHRSGILDLQSFDFVHAGRLWSYQGGSYAGSGTIILTGSVAVELYSDMTLPGLLLDGASEQSVVTVRSIGDTLRSLAVEGDVTLRSGTIDLGVQDIILRDGRFSYIGGTISATSAISVDDISNGEIVLSNVDVTFAQDLAIPNVRVRLDSRIDANSAPLRISQQIVFEDGELLFWDSSKVIIESQAQIVRSGSGTFSRRPTLEGQVRVVYFAPDETVSDGVIKTGIEVPQTAVRDFVVDAGPNVVELQSAVTVSEQLQLFSGALSPGDHRLLIQGGGAVRLDYSRSIAPRFETKTYSTSGPISLIFSGSAGDLSSTDLSFPVGTTIEKLIVRMQEEHTFVLHANRTVGAVLIDSEEGAGFDVNGRSLLVDGNVIISSGLATSETEAILDIEGDLIESGPSRVTGVISATVKGDTQIGGIHDAYLLRAFGDIFVSGRLGGRNISPDANADFYVPGLPNIRLLGDNQVLRFSNADELLLSIDDAVNYLTIDLRDSKGTVRIESTGESHTLGVNRLILNSGVVATGDNDLRLPGNGPGYTRAETARSHVAGSVSRVVQAGQPNPFTFPNGQFDFPVGSLPPEAAYRPVSISFSGDNPASTSTVLRVASGDDFEGGYRGLPIQAGSDVLLDDVSSFHWLLSATPGLPTGQRFNLSVVASEFDSFTAARKLRLVRRSKGDPAEERWSLRGLEEQYDNAIVGFGGKSAPFIQAFQTSGGIPSEPEIMAVGIAREAIPFARVQLVSLLDETPNLQVVLGDSVAASIADFGEATTYLRLTPGSHQVALLAHDGNPLFADSLRVEAGRDYLAIALPINGRPEFVLVEGARATPDLSAKSDVSLAFFNSVPQAGPLSLRSRESESILFEDLPFGQFSESYVQVEAADNGFDLLEDPNVIASTRADLSNRAGMTVVAMALSDAELLLIDNHGRVVSSHIQVAAAEPIELPSMFALHGNYPNPFNPITNILIDLPEAADVTVEVFDLLGRRVMTVDAGALAAGSRRAVAIDASGIASGIYLYQVRATMSAGTRAGSGKMTLIK